jgi:hypothetical protein
MIVVVVSVVTMIMVIMVIMVIDVLPDRVRLVFIPVVAVAGTLLDSERQCNQQRITDPIGA